MNDLIQLNNGEWVTKKEYIQLRSAIDEISKKLNKEQKKLEGVDIGIANKFDVAFIGPNSNSIKNAKLVGPNDTNKLRVGRNPDVVNTAASNSGSENKPGDADFKVRQITFKNGMSIIQAIDSIIKQSSYLEQALKRVYIENEEAVLGNGGSQDIKWYNISADIEIIGWDTKVGDFAYKTTYVIQTYETPVIISSYANKATPYYGPHKRYDYLFTGKNSEIINFSQQFDNTFFTVTLK